MKKSISHWKKSEMSTEGAHSRLLPPLFEMPQKWHHVSKSERKSKTERVPHADSFTLFICGSIAGKPAICSGCKVWKLRLL